MLRYYRQNITLAIIASVCAVMFLSSCGKSTQTVTAAVTTQTSTAKRSTVSMSTITMPAEHQKFATISCERIGLNTDLYWGDSDSDLRYGAGQDTDTALPGSATPALIGGHCQTIFNPLKNVQTGDEFVITTSYGTYTYKVEEIKIIDKNTFDYCILNKTDYQAIIYTCYPFEKVNYVKQDRMMLFCTLQSGPLLVK